MENSIKDLINNAEVLARVDLPLNQIIEASPNEFLKPTNLVFRYGDDLYRQKEDLSSLWLKIPILELLRASELQNPLFLQLKAYIDQQMDAIAKEFEDYVKREFERRKIKEKKSP